MKAENMKDQMKDESSDIKTLLSVEIALKWKRYRDAHFGLYRVTNDEDSYKKSMSIYQTIIKNYMSKNDTDLIVSVTELCSNESDARISVKFLSAGFELASGVDFTPTNYKQPPIA